MHKVGLILKFPPKAVTRPVVCFLAKNFDLTFNILKATITQGKEGIMVLEIEGPEDKLRSGLEFLKNEGVELIPIAQKVVRNEEKCIHCGFCLAVCPSGALSLKKPEFKVIFDSSRCTACEHCVKVCTTKAMAVSVKNSEIEAII